MLPRARQSAPRRTTLDMSASAALWSSGQVSTPITQSGRVVINARKDTFSITNRVVASNAGDPSDFSRDTADENFSVLTHEIAMYDTERHYEPHAMHEESVPVVTSMNGLPHERGETLPKCYTLYHGSVTGDRFTFMGIAGSRALHDSQDAARNEEDCTVQVGGLCTTINNGPEPIRVGEWVCWDYPVPDSIATKMSYASVKTLGVPFTKSQFRVRSYLNFVESVVHSLGAKGTSANTALFGLDLLRAGPPIYDATSDEKDRLAITAGVAQTLRGRIFARAMNTAAVGAQLDLLLGSHLI